MNSISMIDEINNRIERFQRLLRENRVDGALIVQKVDLYYLSGTDQDAHLWVPASDKPLLMVRKSLERALEDAVTEMIEPISSLSQIHDLIKKHHKKTPDSLGLELDILPFQAYQAYCRMFPETRMKDISSLIRGVRMVKSPHELSLIKKAADLSDRLYHHMPDFIRDSETENDLAVKAETFYRSEGHPGQVRTRAFNMECMYGHILAGAGGAVPSASPGPTGGTGFGPYQSQGVGMGKINPHEPILIDYTPSFEGYLCDQSRIFSMGKPPDKFDRAHRVMVDVQDALACDGKPGVASADLYARALKIVEKAGLSEGFMGYPPSVPFVGHGVGLELDEWPVIGKNTEFVLEEGMTMALEPKYVFPGEGVVGIENTFVVTDKSMERFNRFPDDIAVVS
jgi:Xaa-Pro dipeptidase